MKRILGFGAAAATLAACLAVQPLLLGLAPMAIIRGLADFRPAWNSGVSFSLFSQASANGCYILIAVLAVVSAGVAVMAWRAESRLAAMSYGLILGGALGNIVDRARFCAVFDFLFLHIGNWPLFVCNLPDIAISAGVVLLLIEALRAPRPQST